MKLCLVFSRKHLPLVFHSIMGGNCRHLRSKYEMEECHVMKSVILSVNLTEYVNC